MGDYHYQVTTHNDKGSSTRTYTFSYLIVRLPYHGLPDLFIRREGIFDAVKRAFGFDDIDFESAEFSSRFYVQSSDKRFAYDVFHPRMMEFLMQVDPPPIQLASGTLLLHRGTQRWGPDDFRAHLTWAREFLGRWPDHVVASLRT
jgi:hypothetical protein